MHDYAIHRNPKYMILFGLAFFAIIAAPFISTVCTATLEKLQIELGWAKAPIVAIPVFTVYTLIYLLFDKVLWKAAWLRKFLLVPDLNGEWTCIGKTVIKKGKSINGEWTGNVSIRQSWSTMLITLKTGDSCSQSIAASITHTPGIGYVLLYQYKNAPKAGQQDLRPHSGAAELMVSEDSLSAEGYYFTDNNRMTVGEMKMARMNK